ncbi:hypothetical protein [Crateriforma conspicua]|uniref:Uncharacterized protein n=1 Tax=Crateriforma conspicua TaxID=2527996 RepID=A0A5C6FIZ2_9PLAN|nr:hypothetical protein [Crateriforma conspicua]TWU59624.1 hypothetical protein V7x_55340 [Crateriforma conspicua]
MSNPFQTSEQYDDFIGRIAIDEYHDAGKSSDLLEVASKAASVPKGMMAIGISFHGSECVKGTDVSFSVMAVARETFEDFLASGESVPYQCFNGTLPIVDLLSEVKRMSVSVFPKRFENAEFHRAD